MVVRLVQSSWYWFDSSSSDKKNNMKTILIFFLTCFCLNSNAQLFFSNNLSANNIVVVDSGRGLKSGKDIQFGLSYFNENIFARIAVSNFNAISTEVSFLVYGNERKNFNEFNYIYLTNKYTNDRYYGGLSYITGENKRFEAKILFPFSLTIGINLKIF